MVFEGVVIGILLLAGARIYINNTRKELKGLMSNYSYPTEKPTPKKGLHDMVFPSLNFVPLVVPKDEKEAQFVKSFDVTDKEGYLEFFSEFGFVVVRDVFSKDEIEASLSEIWNVIEYKDGARAEEKSWIDKHDELHGTKTILPDRNNSSSWEIKNGWPQMVNLGILGGVPSFDLQAMKNRFNKNILSVYSTLHGTEDLWVSIDRYGIMRPTKNVLINGERVDKPSWKTQEKWIHFDQNPKKIGSGTEKYDTIRFHFSSENNDNYTDKVKLQGLVALLDAREEDGGFQCIPEFHKYIKEWTEPRREYIGEGDFINVPQNDDILKFVQKIPMKAGSIVIWESALPHSNFPNNSDRFRMCQYIKLFPARHHAPKDFLEMRKSEILKHLPKDLVMNDQEKRLLGLQ